MTENTNTNHALSAAIEMQNFLVALMLQRFEREQTEAPLDSEYVAARGHVMYVLLADLERLQQEALASV